MRAEPQTKVPFELIVARMVELSGNEDYMYLNQYYLLEPKLFLMTCRLHFGIDNRDHSALEDLFGFKARLNTSSDEVLRKLAQDLSLMISVRDETVGVPTFGGTLFNLNTEQDVEQSEA